MLPVKVLNEEAEYKRATPMAEVMHEAKIAVRQTLRVTVPDPSICCTYTMIVRVRFC